MCRLFAQVGEAATSARHWLIDASSSMQQLSHANPHGVGIGGFSAPGTPLVGKWAEPAFSSRGFEQAADRVAVPALIGHIRDASPGMGGVQVRNVHPFVGPSGITAHNGVISDKLAIEARLHPDLRAKYVHGDTDSERYMALLEQHLDDTRGNMPLAVERTLRQIDHDSAYESLNFVRVDAAGGVWALRAAPKGNTLYWRSLPAGVRDARESSGLLQSNEWPLSPGTRRSLEPNVNSRSSHVVASQPLDGDGGWNAFEQGQLLHFTQDGARQSYAIA